MHGKMVLNNKNIFKLFVVPNIIQPHPGPTGHVGLFDCIIYTLQGHTIQNSNTANTISNNSYYINNNNNNNQNNNNSSSSSSQQQSSSTNPTIWIPDISILFAVTKDYRDFRIRQKKKIIQYKKKK